jgi:hypothetical protein
MYSPTCSTLIGMGIELHHAGITSDHKLGSFGLDVKVLLSPMSAFFIAKQGMR